VLRLRLDSARAVAFRLPFSVSLSAIHSNVYILENTRKRIADAAAIYIFIYIYTTLKSRPDSVGAISPGTISRAVTCMLSSSSSSSYQLPTLSIRYCCDRSAFRSASHPYIAAADVSLRRTHPITFARLSDLFINQRVYVAC